MPEHRFSLMRIFPYNDRIYDSVHTRENTGQRKSLIRHILISARKFYISDAKQNILDQRIDIIQEFHKS